MIQNSLVLALPLGAIITISIAGALLLAGIVLFVIYSSVNIWFKSIFSGVYVSFNSLIGMKVRKLDIKNIVDAYILAKKSNLSMSIQEVENHILSGGNIANLVKAITMAKNADILFNLPTAKALDLSGKDIVKLIEDNINPRVFDGGEIKAIAKDGVELKLDAKITLKSNLFRAIGGADENTIMAKIVEGIVTTVGSAKSYKVVVENPDLVSETVENMGLDSSSLYQIVSVDITKVDVLNNVTTKHDIAKADADSKLARLKSDEIMAQLLIKEQEAKIKLNEMKAKLLDAESELPRMITRAVIEGKFGALDYYDPDVVKEKIDRTVLLDQMTKTREVPDFAKRFEQEIARPIRTNRPKGGSPTGI